MFCTHCGKELPEGSIFCGACGKPVSQEKVTSATNNTPKKEDNLFYKLFVGKVKIGIIPFPKYTLWSILVMIVWCFIVIQGVSSSEESVNKVSDQAIIATAKKILSNAFIDPSSVSWNDEKIVEKDAYDRYLVYLDATATTKGGGRNREQYYVIFRIEGDQYYSNLLSWSKANDTALMYLKSNCNWGEVPGEGE